jgi:hypothetical protein
MSSSGTQRLEKIYDKLAFLDFLTISVIVFNILDMLSTIIGMFSGKGEEITILLIEILESYGIIGLTLVKTGFSVFLLIPLVIKYHWKVNIYTKSVTTGVGIVSVILLPIYVIIVIQNILLLL